MLGILMSLFHLGMKTAAVVHDDIEDKKARERSTDGATYIDAHGAIRLISNGHMLMYTRYDDGVYGKKLNMNGIKAYNGDLLLYDTETNTCYQNLTEKQHEDSKKELIKMREEAKYKLEYLELIMMIKQDLKNHNASEVEFVFNKELIYLEKERRLGVEKLKHLREFDPEYTITSKRYNKYIPEVNRVFDKNISLR